VNERLREALRRKITRHNKFVHLYAAWSGFLVLCMWVAIYFISRWALVFGRTLTQGVDAELPTRFSWGFLCVIVLWSAAGWLEQKRQPNYLRSNDRTLLEVFLELALFPPRATFSAIRHARERVHLQEPELEMASTLLERIGRAGKLLVDTAADGFPPEVDQEVLVKALQTLELIQVREIKGDDYFAVVDPQRLAAFL
jgi:hypothetical protein